MTKVGIIVDGPGDYNSLKTRFTDNCRILKTDGPRGHDANIRNIVRSSGKQVAMLRECGCKKIIVLVDFEARTEDYVRFVSNLKGEFTRQYTKCKVDASVPNRMIENWYLADITFLSKRKSFLKPNLRQKNFEGRNGKEELKKCFARGFSYIETTHGPQMFAILRFDVARRNSSSFNDFLLML
jgi:hypothetical protein